MPPKIKLSEFFGEDWPRIKQVREMFNGKITEIKGGLMLSESTVTTIDQFLASRRINGKYQKQSAYEDGKKLIANRILPAQEHEDAMKLLARKLKF